MKIEKGVPLSSRGVSRSGKLTRTLREMEVDDSILVTDMVPNQISNLLTKHGRRLGRRFVQRRVEGGQRVWRVE